VGGGGNQRPDEETLEMKTFASTGALWLRQDRTREQGLEYWRGTHGRIASEMPGWLEYRQHHFDPDEPGLWPDVPGVETAIATGGRMDGVAEVTFEHAAAPLKGLRSRKPIFEDERNVFARTLVYTTGPRGGRWRREGHGEPVGFRTVVMVRRREGVGFRVFRRWVNDVLGAALDDAPSLLEVRTQAFLPYLKQLWATPGVDHEEPSEWRYHAAVVLGAADRTTLEGALSSSALARTLDGQQEQCSAIHAYAVGNTYLFRRDGQPTTPD
jgi:hypothetical protein